VASPGATEAHHVGTAAGQPIDSGASRASYAALVIAEIQAHRRYPDYALERSEQGAVGVSFTIGPNGRVASASVVRSSGLADLDAAALAIVRSIAPPPPPGGSFAANTTIRFHVE
jgi:protein TonB